MENSSVINKSKKRNLISVIIWDVISLLIVMTSGFYYHRLIVFTKMFDSISSIFKLVGLYLYIFSVTMLFVFFASVTIYMLYCRYTEKGWNPLVDKIMSKLDIVTFVFKILSVLLFVLIYIINPCKVSGPSMNNTLYNGDYLLSSGMFYKPQKGDIVIFDATNYSGSESFYIKRVIAVGGDELSFDYKTNQLLVNGSPVKEYNEDYTTPFTYEGNYRKIYESTHSYQTNGIQLVYKLEKDEVLVFGDNRPNSLDSRSFGVIHKEDVFGRLILKIGGGSK